MFFRRDHHAASTNIVFDSIINGITVNVKAILDSGSQITTISIGCFRNINIPERVLDILCARLQCKFESRSIKTNVASSTRVPSIIVMLHNVSIIDNGVPVLFGNMPVNLILNTGITFMLLGYEFMFSFANISCDRLHVNLNDFDSILYNELVGSLNVIDMSELNSLYNEILF